MSQIKKLQLFLGQGAAAVGMYQDLSIVVSVMAVMVNTTDLEVMAMMMTIPKFICFY